MITAKHLTKMYGDSKAVDDLSFTIEEGHIYGFLGPNGAGKSTTLNIITGCLAPTSGEVSIDNLDIYENSKEAKKKIGYLPEIPPLYVDQTPREYLEFVADAKKISRKGKNTEIERVAYETHIDDVLDKPIKYLSKGYRQRVGISQALIGDPQIVILDEPTVGLDPMQILEIRELIYELGKKHTVILSSHILSEVQTICDKVLIIYKGKMVAFDAPENLGRTMNSGSCLEIVCECDKELAKEILSGVDGISKIEEAEDAREDGDKETEDITGESEKETEDARKDICRETMPESKFKIYSGTSEIKTVARDLFKAFVSFNVVLLELHQVKTTLEDIFIELTREEEASYDSSTKA